MDSSSEADPSCLDRLCPLRVITSNWLSLWLEELAVALRAFVNAKRDTSQPVTSWSNLVARKWPREYALSKQATGVKCTAQKVMEAIDKNLLHRYEANWGWRGGWPAAAEMYPPCTISLQHGNV